MKTAEPISALGNYPELATRVGIVIADYALLEYQMFILYAALSPKNPAESFSKFYQYISANNKTGLILREAKNVLSETSYKALDRLCDRFKKAANRRTEIAHCVFVSGDNSALMRLRLVRNEPRFEELNHQLIDRTINQYRSLSIDVSAFLTTVVKTPAELLHILHALPRAPHQETLVVPVPLGLQMQLTSSEIEASLSRQGLLRR